MHILKLLIILTLLTTSATISAADEYEIKAIYEKIIPNGNVKAITQFNNIEDVEYLLVETDLDQGKYEVEVTRRADNLYQINNSNLYIETIYCYEYAFSQEAILIIEPYSFNDMTIIFL